MQDLLRKLEKSIEYINLVPEDNWDMVSWMDHEGVLITINEAILIVELIKHQLIECKDRAEWSTKLKDVGEKDKTIDSLTDLPNITRVEVIDEKGRSYVNWNSKNKVIESIQDNGRTLKIFIKEERK